MAHILHLCDLLRSHQWDEFKVLYLSYNISFDTVQTCQCSTPGCDGTIHASLRNELLINNEYDSLGGDLTIIQYLVQNRIISPRQLTEFTFDFIGGWCGWQDRSPSVYWLLDQCNIMEVRSFRNHDGWTFWHAYINCYTVPQDTRKLFDVLLSMGCDPTIRANNGQTVLEMMPVMLVDKIPVLVELGCDINEFQPFDNGQNIAQRKMQGLFNQHADQEWVNDTLVFVKTLINHGLDLSYRDSHGHTLANYCWRHSQTTRKFWQQIWRKEVYERTVYLELCNRKGWCLPVELIYRIAQIY